MLQPTVYRGCAMVHAWRRSGRWTVDALSRSLGAVTVKRSTSPHFMYVPDPRAAASKMADDSHAHAPTEVVQMDGAELLGAIDAGPPPYLYYTGVVEGGQPAGWEKLCRAPSEGATAAAWVQLWAASGGAITQAHYDVADNIFCQCEGVKRFAIWAPGAADALHVSIESPDVRIHPQAASLPPPITVELQPGDALFLPAFYFHHVISATPSISINVFDAGSAARRPAADALACRLPLLSTWHTDLKRRALATAVHELCERIHVPPAEFVTQMIATRFAPLEANNNKGEAEGGGGAARRRRRSAGEPPPWDVLCAEVVATAAECATAVAEIDAAVAGSNSSSCSIDGLGRVERALGASAAERLSTLGEFGPKIAEDLAGGYAAAVGSLTAAHVIESWIVQLFGAAEIFAEIRELASALRSSRRPLQSDAPG